MKKLMVILVACSVTYALNAPYLISATALSDSSVELTWRNNDVGTTGFIIQRKDSTEAAYHFVDSVKSPTQLTYTDMYGLLPTTLYTYQVIAYNTSEISDTSNSVQVVTPAEPTVPDTFRKPTYFIHYWNFDTSKSVRIELRDISNCEQGYRLYRRLGFTSPYILIADTVSPIPKNKDTIIWYDTGAPLNTWCTYKAAVYKSDDSIFTDTAVTYIYKAPSAFDTVFFQKLSDFPVFIDSTCWSARSGDSIILKENPSPAGMFTVINAANPANPVFAGYIDSSTAKSYPLRTLIPLFLNLGVSNSYVNQRVIPYGGNRILVLNGKTIRMYEEVSSDTILVDSLQVPIGSPDQMHINSIRMLLLRDTLAGIHYFDTTYFITTGVSYKFYTAGLSTSGFEPRLPIWTSAGTRLMGGTNYYARKYVQGLFDRQILISGDSKWVPVSGAPSYSHVLNMHDLSSGNYIGILGELPLIDAYNTGFYLSPTCNLATNSSGSVFGLMDTMTAVTTELFGADVRDPHSHSRAPVYRDSVHKRNTLRNILLDTLKKRVYLLFTNNMSILQYNPVPTGAVPHADNEPLLNRLIVISNPHSGVTIVRPGSSCSADFHFYDLSGRVIDKMLNVTSNAVLWRPKSKTMNCYIVVVKSGGERYTKKFMVR